MAPGRRWKAARRRSNATCGDQVPLMKRTAPGPSAIGGGRPLLGLDDFGAQRQAEIAVGIHAQEWGVSLTLNEIARAVDVTPRHDAADHAFPALETSALRHFVKPSGQNTHQSVGRHSCLAFYAPIIFSSEAVGDHLDQDARNAGWSDPSSTENSTGIISFVVTLPFRSFSATTSC